MYQYTPLSHKGSDFRLLKLLKRRGPELECELFSQTLNDGHTPYEALSYTWGSSELVECITLNQEQFWITDNLYAALQCLRWPDRDRFLWIDAVCINQADRDEQGHQVRQMGEIYKNAEKVIFWLGKATSEIMAFMDALSQRLNGQEMLKEYCWENHRIGLLQMLGRQWFTRVWILQEAANAQKADVCCGTQSIPAGAFVDAPSLVLIKDEYPLDYRPVLDVMPSSSRSKSWWAQKPDLRTLLRQFHVSKATDERDKIYALLGMSSDLLDKESIAIDYQRPTCEIVHDTITHLLRSTQSSRSKPFAIHEILNIMDSFTTLDTTCFVQEVQDQEATEILFPHLQAGNVLDKPPSPKDSSQGIKIVSDLVSFVFEERPERSFPDQGTCYSQALKLILDVHTVETPEDEEKYDDGLHVISWGSIERHVKIVVTRHKRNATLKAALKGCDQIVKRLVNTKVGGDTEKEWKTSALREAIEYGHERAAKMILHQNDHVHTQNQYLNEALTKASLQGDEAIAQLLLNKGADVNAIFSNVLQSIGYYKIDTAGVELLINAGADVNAQGPFGNALQAASMSVYDIYSIVELLLGMGVDVNAQGGKYGNALQAASHKGNKKVVKTLLDAGADINAQGGEYGNALQATCHESDRATVELLLDAGADVNAQGGEYDNALKAASAKGDEAIIELLRDAGAKDDF